MPIPVPDGDNDSPKCVILHTILCGFVVKPHPTNSNKSQLYYVVATDLRGSQMTFAKSYLGRAIVVRCIAEYLRSVEKHAISVWSQYSKFNILTYAKQKLIKHHHFMLCLHFDVCIVLMIVWNLHILIWVFIYCCMVKIYWSVRL